MPGTHGDDLQAAIGAAVERIRRAPHATLLLDYDGTLVPFADTPELARPDPSLLGLLRELAAAPGRAVHVVSGRRREDVERWLGALPVGLHAEHGFWSRAPGGSWVAAGPVAHGWRAQARAVMDDFAARTPGALIEEKTVGFAWHHRLADPQRGAAQARALARRLAVVLAGAPVEILSGVMVVEVRPRGIDKGGVVRALAASAPPGSLVVALGDDRTDEDMFAALPPDSLAVHVGPGPSQAALRLRGVAEARAFLRALT